LAEMPSSSFDVQRGGPSRHADRRRRAKHLNIACFGGATGDSPERWFLAPARAWRGCFYPAIEKP